MCPRISTRRSRNIPKIHLRNPFLGKNRVSWAYVALRSDPPRRSPPCFGTCSLITFVSFLFQRTNRTSRTPQRSSIGGSLGVTRPLLRPLIRALVSHRLRRNTVVWCLVLLDPEGGALLREQRFASAAPLSAKWPLERACVNPWINHGCVHRE